MNSNREPITRLLVGLLSIALMLVPLPGPQAQAAPPQQGSTTSVFINEIHYDNTGTDIGEAIEIAGPAGTDLTGWRIVRYNGANGMVYTSPTADPSGSDTLSGTIPDPGGGFGVVVVNYLLNGLQNGPPDGVALVNNVGGVVQFLSYEGTFTAADGPAAGMTSTDIGVVEGSDTPVGHSLQLVGTGATYEHFTWSGPVASSFGAINAGQTFVPPVNQPVVVNCGAPLTTYQGHSASTTVTATDADGTVVDIAITEVTPSPAPGTITLGDLVPASTVGGEASATVTVDESVPPDTYAVVITATNDDSPTPQTGTCTLTVVVNLILPLGTVQGEVGNMDDGTLVRSPYAPPSGNGSGETVTIQGVIYEKTLARTSGGGSNYGFFVQNTAPTADGLPNTSDGIFIYIGRYATLRRDGGGYYTPQIGDEVILRGPVVEYYYLTELSNPYLMQVVRSDVDLDAEVPAFEADPPDNLADANRYWERREGMRAQVPAGSVVLNGRNVFASTLDGEVWLARGDSTIAERPDAYARRAFRDPHPLDNDPMLFDDGNGYRILMGSLGIKAAAGDNAVLIAPARTFDTLTDALIGGVYYSYEKYSVQVEQQLALSPGADPSLNAAPQPFDRAREYSVVTFNVQNLYDYRDDPFDGCDFPDNSGCPGVSPPFDYVPSSDAVYQARLHEIAQQIVYDLHGPEVIMAQEAEDQDICTVADTTLTCGTTDDADGKPDTLQELAMVIASMGGPGYDAAYDRDGADDRGIVSAFLYRTDRVELLPAQAGDPVLGSAPQVLYRSDGLPYNSDVQNPKALNAVLPDDVDISTGVDGDNVFTRPPQVGLLRMWRAGIGASVFTDLYLVDNHFSSGPDTRVGQRTEQAAYNVAIIAALREADPQARATVGGDLNVYPRPDDPFTPGHPLYPSDQLAALYQQGMTNLFDVLVSQVPASAYSYVYQGQAQTLDQMFVTPPALGELVQVRAAHVNSDWPADFDGDGPRGIGDHDPQVARYTVLPTLDRLVALVYYYDANGAITGRNITRILLDRLERARRFQENGKQQAYEDQLCALISQVYDFTPRFITQAAADALAQETAMLLALH